VAIGVVAALAVRADDREEARTELRPGAGPGQGEDPLAYRDDRREAFEERAARGLSHVLFAKSPGGAVATAERVARWRPLVERAAAGGDVDPDVLEGIVFLESAGRADARASNDLEGAVGLTQILAETGQNLLGMRVDVRASERLTRGIARGRRVEARERERRLVDERFDPAKSLAATVRYLNIARGELAGRDDLAVAGYHMGIGNLQTALARFERGKDIPYAELYFGTTPLSAPRTHAFLASLGDDSATYLWRVRGAQRIMAMWRRDAPALAVLAGLHAAKNSAEEVLHPPSTTEVLEDPDALEEAREDGRLEPLDPAALGEVGLALDRGLGELAGRLDREPALYRAARPQVLAVLGYLGTGVREISGATRPLLITSAARDAEYQALLTRRNIEATRRYSLHTTGYAVDIARRYSGRRQARAFQFMLDRLEALDLIAWVREPGAIHFTVAEDAGEVLARGV
jgi:hypothetical protein